MDLVRSWGAAIGVWLAGSLLTVLLFVNFGTLEQVQTFSGRLLVFYLPELVVAILMAAVAALVHPVPARQRRGRHSLAVLAVPALAVVVGLVNTVVGSGTTESLVVALLTMSTGGVAGWQLADLIRPPRPQPSYSHGYPY